ncbi:tripartite tricarboxylate transporter TctB family protein [Amphibiibacter pelophylacis]|uniref:Tripartite tricarboxylate transporter TctB family protein n=1 Tax=Amphibiibacter pelophylacis TaxID=1799477 RepID=A0ACC6P1F0_9BURK
MKANANTSSFAPNRPGHEPLKPFHLKQQRALAVAVLLLGLGLGAGAAMIAPESGYAGIGSNFLPWVVSAALVLCGVLLCLQAWRGGFQHLEEPSGAERPDWHAWAWVSAGIGLNALLMVKLGFVLSCLLCFVLAVRGLRIAEGKPAGHVAQTLKDTVTGLCLTAPVFWLFTLLLGINLPSLTGTRWL